MVLDVGLQMEAIPRHQAPLSSTLDTQPHLALHDEGIGLERVRVQWRDSVRRPGTLQDFVVAVGKHAGTKLFERRLGHEVLPERMEARDDAASGLLCV